MKVIKLYRKPNEPEFYMFERTGERGILVAYPIAVPNRKRMARWFGLDEVYIDWVKEFKGE